MRSLLRLKLLLACAGAALLAGCLVSETPVLDSSNGKATPIASGDYVMCPLEEDEEESDCERFTIAYDETGLYSFSDPHEEDDPAEMRFRRIGRDGYAVQSYEDDGYMYYYGAGDSQRFRLAMMTCNQLPDELRAHLVEDGGLTPEDEEFGTCAVNTLKGLVKPAKAYHRGDVDDGERLAIEFTPAPVPEE